MSYHLRKIRAFSTELMKIAAKINDGDIQKLLADRRGEEYLPGGRLPTNSLEDQQYQQKIANFDPISSTALGMHDFRATKKKKNKYQKVRDYSAAGLKGGLTGLGVLGALNAVRGGARYPEGILAAKAARNAITAGAGIAVADRAYRHDDIPVLDKLASLVNPGLSRALSTPASSAAMARRTGGFKTTVLHRTGKPPKTVQLGKKFRLP